MMGQHIRALKDGRWVHAIDCGDETVLLLAEDVAPPRVRRAYRPEFVAGAQSVESITHRERTFPAREVVRRAYSRAADPALAAMFRDSEAFADWCTTGRLSGPHNVAVGVPGVADTTPAAAAPRAAVRARAKARPAKAAKRTATPRKPKRSPKKRARPTKRSPRARSTKRAKPTKRKGARR